MITLFICVESPFTQRDYERFGVERLQSNFQVLVIDCSPWLQPVKHKMIKSVHFFPGYHSVNSFSQIREILYYHRKSIVIDYLAEGTIRSERFRRFVRRQGMLLTKISSGLIPTLHEKHFSLLQRLTRYLLKPKFWPKMGSLLLKQMTNRKPVVADIAMLSGTSALDYAQYRDAIIKIPAHSLDYDIFLSLQHSYSKPKQPYAVFLDEDAAYHPDFLDIVHNAPVSAACYYPELLHFFDTVEQRLGLSIIIAAHPRSRYDLRPHLLGDRHYVLGSTAELVQHAELVFLHQSTSLSFAVLWKKPVVFLTSDELHASWAGAGIALRASMFRKNLVNVSQFDATEVDETAWLSVDHEAYDRYREEYIKVPGSPEKSTWDIFSDFVLAPESTITVNTLNE